MNIIDEITKVFSDFENNLSQIIKKILEENPKMGINTHKTTEKIVTPPNPVQNPSVDLDINLNLNINIRPHIFPMEFEK